MSLRLGVQRLLKSTIKPTNFIQRRCDSVVAGPPLNPLSDVDCLIYGGALFVGILFMPVYTLLHIREYAGNA